MQYTGLEIVFMPMKDFTPPSMAQIHQFVAIVDKADKNGKVS